MLALSGDYPVTGHKGLAAPVFDIDSVGLLSLFSDLNDGIRDERKPDARLDKTNFFLGCVVTNHKRREREVMPQYFKLRKKVRAGARFVINQIGWNTRKDDELLRWIRREQLPVSVLANVYLMSRSAARAFHQGKIPGVVVTDELLALVERQAASEDKGRAFFVELAAKHSPSRAVSASPASTSAATCLRRRSARSSTWPARSAPTTGARSHPSCSTRPRRVLLLRAGRRH